MKLPKKSPRKPRRRIDQLRVAFPELAPWKWCAESNCHRGSDGTVVRGVSRASIGVNGGETYRSEVWMYPPGDGTPRQINELHTLLIAREKS